MSATLTSRLPEIGRQISDLLRDGLSEVAEKTHANLAAELESGRKHGVVYGTHRASAPGESPASDTRALERSIEVEQVGDLAFSVQTDDPKAPLLEYGTTRMSARPMWTPVAERTGKTLERAILVRLNTKLG